MDNLTHSMAGMLIAEAAWQWVAARNDRLPAAGGVGRHDGPTRRDTAPRGLLYLASILANNLPDLDFVLTPLTEGKLGYMLHHRGHTHTVLVALVMAALQSLLAALWLRRRRPANWQAGARLVTAVSGIGVLVHLLLDFGNNYGVHPFWPIDARWLYGDTVFIIEPWWWSVGGAALLPLVRSRAAKWTQGVIWAVGTGVAWFLPLPIEVGIYSSLLGALAFATLGLRGRPLRRLTATAGVLALFYSAQLVARGQATAPLARALAAEPSLEVLDLVRTPLPGAPWCWDVVVVALETRAQEQTYVLRLARATALPGLSAQRCPKIRQATTAPLRAIAATTNARLHWDGEYRLSAGEFTQLAQSCWGRAFLRFSRAPFVAGEPAVVGDLRFDRSSGIEFTEFELPRADAQCPRWVPGWEPPRRDALERMGARDVPPAH